MKERIIEVRKKNHLSQDAFAKRLGLSRNFIGLVENGDRNFSDRTIKDLCREFNINEYWLRTGIGDPDEDVLPLDENAFLVAKYTDVNTPLGKAYLKFLKVYDRYPDDKKPIVNDFIESLLEEFEQK